jgi:flagellar motility protein MotE (MotC chaperone)
MENQYENDEKQYNKLQWFLFVVLIPIAFTITITLLVLWVAGVNVIETSKEIGKNLPYISNLMEKDKKTNVPAPGKDNAKQIDDLKAKIKGQDDEITKLENLVDSRDQQLQRTDLEKQQLEKQIEELTATQEENKRAFKDIIRTYETMSPKKSAPIFAKMSDNEAVKILSNVKAETLAQILEQMTADDAARLTKRLTVESKQN